MALSKASIEKAQAYYDENYKGKGLGPRHASGLKEAIATAYQKGEKPRAAAQAFLKEKGVSLNGASPKKEAPAASKKPKKKAAAEDEEDEPEEEEVVKEVPKKKVEKKPEQLDLELEPSKLIDKAVLQATVKELLSAGLHLPKTDEKSSDDVLRRAIHHGLADVNHKAASVFSKLPGEATVKLLTALGCVGLFVDVANADCAACPDQVSCVRSYLRGSKEDFAAAFAKAGVEAPKVEKPKNGAPKEEAPKKSPFQRAYKSHEPLCVLDVPNPEKKGTVEFAFVARVLSDEGPRTIGELAPIWRYYKDDGLPYPTLWEAIAHLTEAGVACTPEWLPKEIKDGLSVAEKKELGL